MKYWLKMLLSPFSWLQQDHYSSAWDKKLLSLLETDKFTNITEYHATIGGFTVWISNHPYASFRYNKMRPKITTIFKAREKLEKDMLDV